MVLTENDHLNFFFALSNDPQILPPIISSFLSCSLLVFIGYSVMDQNFHQMLHLLMKTRVGDLGYPAIIIQSLPLTDYLARGEEVFNEVIRYLGRYFDTQNARIYYGSLKEFVEYMPKSKQLPELDNDIYERKK